jgi:hypothetical protein
VTEEVTFTQITAEPNRHRDALRFQGGREIRLQELSEGQRVRVLDVSSEENTALVPMAHREAGLGAAW